MNKSELVEAISECTCESTRAVQDILNSLEAVVTQQVQLGEKVAITGFVSFEPTTRGARTGRNPKTGEIIQIAESKGCKVAAGTRLISAIKRT